MIAGVATTHFGLHQTAEVYSAALAVLAAAAAGIFLFRGGTCFYDAIGGFREIAEALGCAVAVMPDAKGLFPEDHPVPSHLLGTSD